MSITQSELDNWFTHHPSKSPKDIERYQRIRNAGLAFAEVLVDECPPGADLSAAIRKIREAVMTANAAIACDGA